ncbi:hypothetical protein [uncultured Agrobacterium sp.]|uniref:hypothetical protein n=1 Tax=uncultured Agrobacterium sp. TaxID=157277 RepID=UPI002587819E|nr:hypothetical protein [uncultured Agrobacterium sp.]
MTKVEDTTPKELVSSSEFVLRVVYLFLCLVLFNVSYAAAAILSLPLPVPDNMALLLFALSKDAFFSQTTGVLFTVAVFWGRSFDRPSPPNRKYLDFPGWLLKQPFAGICLGLTIFISPLLIAIGLQGIAYLLAGIFVLYSTPRLLAQGPPGAALLLTAWSLAGFFLAKLVFSVPAVRACEGNASVELRSGTALPCEDFVIVQQVNGLVIRHQKTSFFVKIDDLARSASDTLRMDSWFWRIRSVY